MKMDKRILPAALLVATPLVGLAHRPLGGLQRCQ